jgi:hypothetical protein
MMVGSGAARRETVRVLLISSLAWTYICWYRRFLPLWMLRSRST